MRGTNLQGPYMAEIFTDESIYSPGSHVTGKVIFTLKRSLQFDKLLAVLRGYVEVKFVLKPGNKEILGYRQSDLLPKPIEYKNHRQLVNQTVILWSQGNAIKDVIRRASKTSNSSETELNCIWGLDAGVHTFNFVFQLPETDLYTSFDANGSPAKVRYLIEVLSQYGDAEVLRGETLVAVVCPEILIVEASLLKEQQSFVQTKQISKNEQLSVQLTLKQTKFLPGDAIEGKIMIHNRTKRSVKYAHLNVVHKLLCFSSVPCICQFKHEIHEYGIGMEGDKVAAGRSYSYPITLNIAALVPQLNVPNCLLTSYELQFSIGFLRNSPKAAVLNINVPIEIGTELSEITTAQLPTAPPAYDEILVQ